MEHNLIEEFAKFLKSKGKAEEADNMLETYKGFSERIKSIEEDILKAVEQEKEQELEKELEEKNLKPSGITLADCDFMVLAILPTGYIHAVENVSSEDMADLIASKGRFRVSEEPVGKIEVKTDFIGGIGANPSTDKKYLN